MAAVVDSAAGLWWVVCGAEVLPFAGTHFGTCEGGAGRVVGEETRREGVGFLGQEAAEFVEPDAAVDAGRWLGKILCGRAVDGDAGARRAVGVGV